MKSKNIKGRPTKYRTGFARLLIDYFDKSKAAFEVVDLGAGQTARVPLPMPTFEDFAALIGVGTSSLDRWKKAHPEFREAYARARTRQTAILVKGGMAGVFDSRFAALAAKNLAGWRDKPRRSHEDARSFSTEEISQREVRMRSLWVARKASRDAHA